MGQVLHTWNEFEDSVGKDIRKVNWSTRNSVLIFSQNIIFQCPLFNFVYVHRPELMGLYQNIYSQKQKKTEYWLQCKNQILDLCNRKNIPARIYFQRAGVY